MIRPPEADVRAGMETYATGTPPCSARIKSVPEDFRVEEDLSGVEVVPEPGPGMLPLYRVEKRGIDTFHLQKELAASLRSRVAFAGMKDKRAVSVQYATPTSTRSDRPRRIDRERFRADLVGFVARPLSKGAVSGNSFELVLRDCCPEIKEAADSAFGQLAAHRLPNYYGLQRFGGAGALTHRIGREMVKADFEGATRVLLSEPRAADDQETAQARKEFSRGNYAEGERLLPRGQDVERLVAGRLSERPDDAVWGLRGVPIGLRRLFTQAFQSYIFNRSLSAALRKGTDISLFEPGDNWGEVSPDGLVLRKVHGVREPAVEGAVPLLQLPGYAYRNYGSRFDACTEEVMAEEGVSSRDFYLEEMQEASVEGGFRRPFMSGRSHPCEASGSTARLRFVLARGEYATVLVREMVKPQDPAAQGFA